MRWLPSIALGLSWIALPLAAQHGGGAHGGGAGHAGGSGFHGGGFSAHGAPAFRGSAGAGSSSRFGLSGAGRMTGTRRPGLYNPATPRSMGYMGAGQSAFTGQGRAGGPRYGGIPGGRAYGGTGRGLTAGMASATRPTFYNRGRIGNPGEREHDGFYGRQRGNRFGYSNFGYPGFVTLGLWDPFLDYADYDGFDQGDVPYGAADAYAGQPGGAYSPAESAQAYGQGTASESHPAQPSYGYTEQPPPAEYAAPSGDQGGPLVYAPSVYRQRPAAALRRPAAQESLVTIYFRDGRAPEQIRNYALTRTSLLVTGPSMREIPLTDLDLTKTESVNRAAGVDFRLP